MSRRLSLQESKLLLEQGGKITIDREEGEWVARYSSNKHVICKFANGYSMVHAGLMVKEENREDVATILKDASYEDWFAKRRENQSKAFHQAKDYGMKVRRDVVQRLSLLTNMEEVQSFVDELRQVVAEYDANTQEA